MNKICKTCQLTLPSESFYFSTRHKDRLTAECKECCKFKRKRWYQNNKERAKKTNRDWDKANPDKKREYLRRAKEKMGDKALREYHCNYNKLNKERLSKRKKERHHERLKNDFYYKLKRQLRRRIFMAFKRAKTSKSTSTYELVGCPLPELKKHIESKFCEGMSWDNHGKFGWHIDHIIPCSSFDLTILEEQKKCFHYSNLQPLWAADNLRKGSKIIFSF